MEVEADLRSLQPDPAGADLEALSFSAWTDTPQLRTEDAPLLALLKAWRTMAQVSGHGGMQTDLAFAARTSGATTTNGGTGGGSAGSVASAIAGARVSGRCF